MKKILRLLKIYRVLMRNGLDEVFIAATPYRSLRLLKFFNIYTFFNRGNSLSRGARIRISLEQLGPIFVKFGQILSTRRDLLAEDIAAELVFLQDRVPPFDSTQARTIIEDSLAQPIDEIFSHFEMAPLASASVAQVHAATLHSGEEVVIKVLRPGIKKVIKRDLALLYTIAQLIENFSAEARRLRIIDVVAEFEHSLLDELDLQREASNASQLRRNFQNSRQLYVPEIHWSYTRLNVMVMERIHGIPVANIEQLKTLNVDLKKLAQYGVEIFFTQVFRDCFFHADMHAGNIFVNVGQPAEPHYIAVDFGIMGTLTPEDQHYLAYNLIAFFRRDYRKVAELHIESNWVPAKTRLDEFESAIRAVCEPIFERPIKEISFAQMLLRLFQTARRFQMIIQPQLVMLQKTLVNIEGLGRQLYPDLNLWDTAKPFLEQWMHEQVGLKAFARKARDQAPFWIAGLSELPDKIDKIVNYHPLYVENNKRQLAAIEALQLSQRKASRSISRAIVVAAVIIAIALLIKPPLVL